MRNVEKKKDSELGILVGHLLMLVALGGLFLALGWNYGIVPLLDATGVEFDKIDYLTGLFTALSLMAMRGLLHRP